MTTSRELFAGIAPVWLFYVLVGLVLAVFAYGLYRRLAPMLAAREDRRPPGPIAGIKGLVDGLTGRQIWPGDFWAGLIHLGLIWGFGLLFLGTLGLMVDEYLVRWLTGSAYVVYSVILELAGAALVLASAGALIRRLIGRPQRLERRWDDLALPALLLLIGLTGFVVEQGRIFVTGAVEPYAFIGAWLARTAPLDSGLYRLAWWVHALSALGLIAVFPFTKLAHAIFAPAQLAYQALPRRALTGEEMLEPSQADVLARVTCVRCGRCLELCPAQSAQEGFNARWFIQSQLEGRGGDIWNCATCGACLEVCPLEIASPELIVKDRGAIVEQGTEAPPEAAEALESIHKHKNPWGAPRRQKAAWARKAKAPVLARLKRPVETLYFVGCTTSVETRAIGIAQAMAELLTAAEEDWAVLGDKEPCCGDMARVLGEFGLLELCWEETTEALTEAAEGIVVSSPHCLHTLTAHYPDLAAALDGPGLEAPVEHYSQRLARLIDQGKLEFGQSPLGKVTYHDPCYLGRWGGEYEAPRRVLSAIPGLELTEMPRNREHSFCCGGGGGRSFRDFEAAVSPAELRLREAEATGAEAVVTACPICLIMLTDAAKTAGLEDKLEVIDLAELAARALG